MVKILNAAGEEMAAALSDAEAARWWLEAGRVGDTIDGESAQAVVEQIFPDATWEVRDGEVIDGKAEVEPVDEEEARELGWKQRGRMW